MSANPQLISKFKELIPKLNKELHKGQNGRIGIAGGSRDYSGAPYFASISSLRAGADLSYVFTTTEASPIIKSYSPEMIVLPILSDNNETEMRQMFSKIHSLVVGPGLGRSEQSFKSFENVLVYAKAQNLPIVIDADGLFILSKKLSLVEGYEKCILTPNVMEFKLLYDACFTNDQNDVYDEKKIQNTLELQCEAVKRLASKLKNLTVIKKGSIDIISNGDQVVCNDLKGSLKRCGGIGDILSGTLATFAYWCNMNANKNEASSNSIIACYSASVFVKECSRVAFDKFHRSVLAVDVIEQMADTFYQMFDKS